jgi:hypothetical protein
MLRRGGNLGAKLADKICNHKLATEAHTINVIIVDLAGGVRRFSQAVAQWIRCVASWPRLPPGRQSLGDIKKASEREHWPIGLLVCHRRVADQARSSLS